MHKNLEMKFPFNVIDLTHPLSSDLPSWDMSCGFECNTLLDYNECTTNTKFKVQALNFPSGIGTHIDAPAHCDENGKSVEEISIDELIVPFRLIDISDKCSADYICSVSDIISHESAYGVIPKNSFVIIHTGWGKYWSNPLKYRNELRFPSIANEVALLLLERGIVGIGVDTLSPDTPESGYPVHKVLLGSGKYIIENIANSESLPIQGGFIMGLPLPIVNGTEAPLRLIALLPKENTYE